MIKKTIFIIALIVSVNLFSQNINLDKYQYIVVANKFDFLKGSDQFQTSSLTKFLLKKKGFEVFLDNEVLPNDIIKNRCLGLMATVIDESTMFVTKNRIELKDCYGKVIYTSKIGRSKVKEYKKAYQEAIRAAYNTMEDFEYSFKPSLIVQDKVEEKVVIPVKTTPATIVTPVIKKITPKVEKNSSVELPVLYAQSKLNGFQLVNLKPEVVFIILKTSIKDVYLIKDKNGSLYKNGTHWVAEYYDNNELVQKTYQIKF